MESDDLGPCDLDGEAIHPKGLDRAARERREQRQRLYASAATKGPFPVVGV